MEIQSVFHTAMVAVLCLLSSVAISKACPNECTCDVTTVNCSSRGLTSVPSNIPTDVTVLHLDHNEITSIDANDLSSLVNLIDLFMSHNKITDILSGAFSNLAQLQRLFLDANEVPTLPGGIFNDLSALTTIGLSDNRLTALPNGIFDGCTILVSVDLANNSLDENVFATITNVFWLVNIDLSGNDIPLLPYLMLTHAEEMTTLVLSDSGVVYLDSNSLVGMDSLTFLYIANNNITSLKREVFQPVTSHISVLDVTGNPLECDCDTKKFQDWLVESTVTFNPMTCYDYVNGADVDVKTGDFSHLCTDTDTPLPTFPPTCKPEQETCGNDAMLTFMTSSIDETTAVLSWEYSDVIENAEIEVSCRQHMGSHVFTEIVPISTQSIILTPLTKGTEYSCCGLILSCDVYSCTDFVTQGKDTCSNTEYIIAISILVTLLVLAIVAIIVLILLRVRHDHKMDNKHEEILRNQTRWNSSQSSLVSVNNNNRITMISMGSMNSHLSNDSNVGRPLPKPGDLKRESLYEHIPEAKQVNMFADPRGGCTNQGFSDTDTSSVGKSSTTFSQKSEPCPPPYSKEQTKKKHKKKGIYATKSDGATQIKAQQMANIPGSGLSSQYLTPIDNPPRKPRRFVRARQQIRGAGSEPNIARSTSLPFEHVQSSDDEHVVTPPPRTHSRSEGDIRENQDFVNFNPNGQKSGSLNEVSNGNVSRSISQEIVPYLPPKKLSTETDKIDLNYYQQIINGGTDYDV